MCRVLRPRHRDRPQNGRPVQVGPHGYRLLARRPLVLRLLPRSDSFPNSAAFSPDGNRAAVLWWPGDSTGNYHFVQIYDIPSGGKGRRLDLPPGRWQWIREWSADRLYAEVDHRRVYSFSLADDDFGTMRPEPLLTHSFDGAAETFCETGPGWVAHIEQVAPVVPQLQQWLEWIGLKAGSSLGRLQPKVNRVRFLDPQTGAQIRELPQVALTYAIAPNGRFVAAIDPERSLEVWAVQGRPVWAWAAAAGAISGALILSLAAYARGRGAKLGKGGLSAPAGLVPVSYGGDVNPSA